MKELITINKVSLRVMMSRVDALIQYLLAVHMLSKTFSTGYTKQNIENNVQIDMIHSDKQH